MIILKYLNSKLQNGLTDWKKVYQFPEQTKKFPFIDQSKLCYNLSRMLFRVTYNGRGLAKYGNRCLSSPEQMLIEKLLMKITTKSQIYKCQPEPLLMPANS